MSSIIDLVIVVFFTQLIIVGCAHKHIKQQQCHYSLNPMMFDKTNETYMPFSIQYN